jgi:hypothetical protein
MLESGDAAEAAIDSAKSLRPRFQSRRPARSAQGLSKDRPTLGCRHSRQQAADRAQRPGGHLQLRRRPHAGRTVRELRCRCSTSTPSACWPKIPTRSSTACIPSSGMCATIPLRCEKLLDLFHKAGEIHSRQRSHRVAGSRFSVQAGDLPRARDLYQKLATMEPGNPLHMQNYQQVVSQLGGPSGSKLITRKKPPS